MSAVIISLHHGYQIWGEGEEEPQTELRKAFRQLDFPCRPLIDNLWSINSYDGRNISNCDCYMH